MPAKRTSRRKGNTPVPEDVIPPATAPSPKKTRVSGLAGNAAKHSESYGSPPTARPIRSNHRTHGSDLKAATFHVFAQVQEGQRRMAADRKAMLARKAAKGQQVQEDAGYVHGGDEDEDEELSQVGVEDFADEDIDMLRDEPDGQSHQDSRSRLPESVASSERQILGDASTTRAAGLGPVSEEPTPADDQPSRSVSHLGAHGTSTTKKKVGANPRKRASSDEDEEDDQEEAEYAARLAHKEAQRRSALEALRMTATHPSTALTNRPVNGIRSTSQQPTSATTRLRALDRTSEPPSPHLTGKIEGTPRQRSLDTGSSGFTGRSFIEESMIFATTEVNTSLGAPHTATGSLHPAAVASVSSISQQPFRTHPIIPVPTLQAVGPSNPPRDDVIRQSIEEEEEEEEEKEEEGDDAATDEDVAQDEEYRRRRGLFSAKKPSENAFRAAPPSTARTDSAYVETQSRHRHGLRRQPRPGRQESPDEPQSDLPGKAVHDTSEGSPDSLSSERRQILGRPLQRGPSSGVSQQSRGRQVSEDSTGSEAEHALPPLFKRLRARVAREARKTWAAVQALNLWSLAAAALLSLALVWFSLMMRGFVQGHNSLHWYGLRDWHHNLGQFFPAVGHLSNDEYASLSHDLFKQSASVRGLGDRLDHTEAAVETLNNILPQVVHVKRSKTGQVVVADDFWHALKDLIEHDTSVFNTEQPMQRMQQMASNIEKQVQTVAGKTFSKSWESWLKNNQRKVGQILGQAWATELPDEVEKKILAYSEKVFNEKTAGSVLPPYVLKKEDFMAELDKALKAETKERSDELESLRRKVEEIATDTENIMSQQGKGGLSRSDRDEMRTMAEQVTRDAIARAQLDGTASSRIAKHLGHLDYKVNHFAVGNGPSVDEALTSPTFVAPERARASRPWWRSVLRFRPRSHAAAALTSWEEPGECWCAGNRHRDGRPRPVDMAVGLRTSIVPQHLVVEHIDPDTTVDGRAMPRDVEIWARIDDARSRDVATDYMRATWPGHQGDEPLLALGFVQIGAFTYEYSPQSKGSHVYRFPLDLVRIGAETDHVVVRALSNHGAGHTCFYRIRLYGEPREALLEE